VNPDGRRRAYAIREGGESFVIVDGETHGPYDGVGLATFSPDSLRRQTQRRRFVLVDGHEGMPYDRILQAPYFVTLRKSSTGEIRCTTCNEVLEDSR
jgi:hypothetical protein